MLHGRRTFLAPLPKRNSRDGGATIGGAGQLENGERLRRPGGPREPSKTIDGTVPTPKEQMETLCQGRQGHRRSFRSETSNLMRAYRASAQGAQTTATAWFLLVPGMFQQLGLAKLAKLAKLQSHMRLHWLGLVISDWDFKNLKAFSI